MRVGFVSGGGVQKWLCKGGVEKCDLTVSCFEEERVSYQGELKGETHLFEDVALASKKTEGLFVCGAQTEAYGQLRNSAIIAQKGRILGVADMTRGTETCFSCGTPLRLFDTCIGKIGVLVADDLYFVDTARSLCDCGADYLVCTGYSSGELEKTLVRATAFFCGTPVIFCGRGGGLIANMRAEEVFFSPVSPVYTRFEGEKEYHLIYTRKRQFLPEKAEKKANS